MELLENTSIEVNPNLTLHRFEKTILPNLQDVTCQMIKGETSTHSLKPIPQLSERDVQLLKRVHQTRELINQLAEGIGDDA